MCAVHGPDEVKALASLSVASPLLSVQESVVSRQSKAKGTTGSPPVALFRDSRRPSSPPPRVRRHFRQIAADRGDARMVKRRVGKTSNTNGRPSFSPSAGAVQDELKASRVGDTAAPAVVSKIS